MLAMELERVCPLCRFSSQALLRQCLDASQQRLKDFLIVDFVWTIDKAKNGNQGFLGRHETLLIGYAEATAILQLPSIAHSNAALRF
jgi:hypothetical protein